MSSTIPTTCRDCEKILKEVVKGSKSEYLSKSDYYKKLSDVADKNPFKTEKEKEKCKILAKTLENLYDINKIVKRNYFDESYIDSMQNIIDDEHDSTPNGKDKTIAKSVKNELECIKLNNNAKSIEDYHKAFEKSKVKDIYEIFKANENIAKNEDADKENSRIVGDYNRNFGNLDTLKILYDKSTNGELRNSISNNYIEIFKYLIKRDSNSAISKSFNNENDYNCAINNLQEVINNYNSYYPPNSYFPPYEEISNINNTLQQNMDNLKERKINFYIKEARRNLNNIAYSCAKSYIDNAYNAAKQYNKSTYNIERYRIIIYNAESDYYNSEGRRCFNNNEYDNALSYYKEALNKLPNYYRDISLENNIKQNKLEVENTKKNIEADKLHREGLSKYKEKNLSDYELIKEKFTSAKNIVVDKELKKIIENDLNNLEKWKLNLTLEKIKTSIEINNLKFLEGSLKDLKSFLSNSQVDSYIDIIVSYTKQILNTLFEYYFETTDEDLAIRINKTKKFLSDMKDFNTKDKFIPKFDENEIRYYEGIIYCLEAEQIRKKGDKENYYEAYIKYKKGIEKYQEFEDLISHMQIWKKNMFEAFCKKCIESEDEEELKEFIKENEQDKMDDRINELKSHWYACNIADIYDNDNISKEDIKSSITNSLKKQPKNPSLHQMNIIINNDSDELQNEAVLKALDECPDDPEINHIASLVFQNNLVKGKIFSDKEKEQLNKFNNKLLNSKYEVWQNDGMNFINAQNEKKEILDERVFNSLCKLQKNENENTAIKASKLITDNLKINNKIDINKDEKIKTIINDGIQNENVQIQNNYLGLMVEKGNFESSDESNLLSQICEKNINEGINLGNSLAIINNITQKDNKIQISDVTTKNIFTNLNLSSLNNTNNDNILSILNNSSKNLPENQTKIYKENLPDIVNKFPENKNSVELLDNLVEKIEVNEKLVDSFYDGLNSNKSDIKEKYVSIIEKMDFEELKEIPSDISNSLIKILKKENKPEVQNSILNIFDKNKKKFILNENQNNQIKTQRLCNELDNALNQKSKKENSSTSFSGKLSNKEKSNEKDTEKGKKAENEIGKNQEKETDKETKKEPENKIEPNNEEGKKPEPKEEDNISKILEKIKTDINNIKTEEESFQNKLASIIEIEGYDEKIIKIIMLMINRSNPIYNNIKNSICNKIAKLLEKDKNDKNLIGYFYIMNNLIKSCNKNEERNIIALYTNILNNITEYNNNNLINEIISGSVLISNNYILEINDNISDKLFQVYSQNKNLAENISILLANLFWDNYNKINLEEIFKFMTENKSNEIIVKNCCRFFTNEERVEKLFKNEKYQEDVINIIKKKKKIPIEIINVVDLIKNKKPDLEDLIQLNKYFINIKKEENIDKNVSRLLNYKNKNIKINDEHVNIIFTKLTKNETMKRVYELLKLVSNEIIIKNYDSINKLINTDILENVVDILINKKITLSKEIINFYIKILNSDNEQQYNKTLEFLSKTINNSLNKEQKLLIEILISIKEDNLINNKVEIKKFLDKINNNKIPNKKIASFLGKIILETKENEIFKNVAINYFKNLSCEKLGSINSLFLYDDINIPDYLNISKKIFERIKKNLFETEDINIHKETIQLLSSFDTMGIEIQNDFIIELMTNDKLTLNNNQNKTEKEKITASIIEFLLNLIKSNKLEFKTFYDSLCKKEDIRKMFESLKLRDISSSKYINDNIEKIREVIEEFSYYKYNLDQIILDSITDIINIEEKDKFIMLYQEFKNDKKYSIVDKYLLIKVLFNPKNKFQYNLFQINEILYIINKLPKIEIEIIFNMKEDNDFHNIFKLLFISSLLNEKVRIYLDDINILFKQNESFTIENIDIFLSNIKFDNKDDENVDDNVDNRQMLVNILKSINNHKIKFNEFEEIYEKDENGKIKKIKLKGLFNKIIDKVFEKIFSKCKDDIRQNEILNARKIFKNANWNMDTFRYMVNKENPFLFYSLNNKDELIINKACEIISLFQLSNGNEIIKILEDIYYNNPNDWEEKWILELNKLGTSKIMRETKREDQPIENYLKDIFYCNKKGANFEKQNIRKNKKLYDYIILSEKKYYQILESIKYWTTMDCINWITNDTTKKLFNSDNKDFIPFVFAVFSTLNANIGVHKLKRIQLLSLLLLTSNFPYGGVFCQIGTGEGKSTIVEFLSAFLALTGNTVDIISSSPILAERDSKDKKKIEFFECLGLKVSYSSNNNDKFRYKKHILYGDVLTNEGDILRDVYEKTDIRKGRKFHYIIIDEVDNLSLDNLSSKTQLVSSFPGKDYLYPFYFCILIKLPQLDEEYKNDRNKIELVKSELLKAINDLYQKEIKVSEKKRAIFYPEYLKEGIKSFIPLWVDSAITIYYQMKENKDFIINENGEINPVDFSNTGIVQRNMVWENGMHQMLQIINELRIHPETTGTNYLSNVSYFKKYFKNNKSNIFGVTGTIGEKSSQKILIDIYEVDIYFIPRALKNQLRIYGAIIVDNKEKWLNEIMNDAIRETRNQRGVLIICKSIGVTEELFELFKNKQENSITNILLYNKNEDDKNEDKNEDDKNEDKNEDDKNEDDKNDVEKTKNREKDKEESGKRARIVTSVESKLFSGYVIISTNLAGRGTDIKLDQKVINNGGLHVIVSFLPDNKRIEDQNFGRAARNGQPGTGRLILNKTEEGFKEDDIREVKKIRAQNEFDMITQSMKTEVPKQIFEDELFDKFCIFLDEIVDQNKLDENLFEQSYDKSIKERSICIKKNTEEMWGAFIKTIQDRRISENEDFEQFKKEKLKNFKEFKQDILDKIKNKKIFQNPFLNYKRFGTIFYNGYELDDYSKKEYESLLTKESFLNFGLYYNYAVYNIIKVDDFKMAKNYYEKAKKNLEDFSNLFLDKILMLNSMIINKDKKEIQKKKIPIQKSFDNKKISINGVITMINQNLSKIEEFWDRRNKKNEKKIYLVKDTDEYIKDVLKSKTEIKDEEDLKELVEFYEDFGIKYLIVLKIRKEIDWLSFFVVLFTGIVEVAIGVCLICSGYINFGAFLLKQGINDIKKSIDYYLGKAEINLGDWAKNKALNFLTYVITSLIPGGSEMMSTGKEIGKQIVEKIGKELLNNAAEYFIKEVISKLKKEFKDFIKKNFVDKILSLFDNLFNKIGKNIAFAFNAIDSAKNIINDIVEKFKELINVLKGISQNIISLYNTIINEVKSLREPKISKIPDYIKDTFTIFDKIKQLTNNFNSLPKIIEEIMSSFNFENKIKKITKYISGSDKECDDLENKYNENFENTTNEFQKNFKSKYDKSLTKIKGKLENEIKQRCENLKKNIELSFKDKFNRLSSLLKKENLTEDFEIFNNLKENLMEEIKNKINKINTKLKENFLKKLSPEIKDIETKAGGIIQNFSKSAKSSLGDLKNNFKEYSQLIPEDEFNKFKEKYFKDNFKINEKIGDKFNFMSNFENLLMKQVNNEINNMIGKGVSSFKNMNIEDAFGLDNIENLKKKLKEKADISNILNQMKNKISENIENNFNKNFNFESINFNFNKEGLLTQISNSLENSNPFKSDKINFLKENLFNGLGKLEEQNLLKQPSNLLNLLKVKLNSNEKNQFSLNDCKKISRILISNGVINKEGQFDGNLFQNGFKQFINLEIPSLDVPTEPNNKVSSIDEIDLKEFSGKKDIIINTIKNLGNSVQKSSFDKFKEELKIQISNMICKEIEKFMDNIFDVKKYF